MNGALDKITSQNLFWPESGCGSDFPNVQEYE